MTFEEYFTEKMDEYRSFAIQNGTTKKYEFLRSSLAATVDYGDLENFDIIENDNYTNQWQPAAVSFNEEFNQLVVIDNIFGEGDLNELGSLTKTEINSSFKRAHKFIIKCVNEPLISFAETNSDLYHVSARIKDEWSSFKNVEILILSNKKISKRIDELKQNSPIGNKELAVGIWDLKRFYEVESSESEREEIIIDFTEKPLEALRASSTDEMDSYLVMMPGEKLAEIYGHWKSRILEQNVRSYLQNRSNVNKGILLTLAQMPSRFFAYNNGITTTGETIEFDSTNKHITKIHNLQIVNGGQTTASIYRASREKIDLSEVNVQMKVTVISKDKINDLVPNIAKFANSQNPVNAADLFSNHPFHQKIENFSRKLIPPTQENKVGLGKWFYERSRGQYLNEQNDKTPSQRKEFQRDNPKIKLITKTDLGLILNSWDEKPYVVSKGAQANFKVFASTLKTAEEWEKNNAQFNEEYFINLIVKTIVMRSLRKEIPKQEWYEGFPANIVTYSIAFFAYSMRLSKVCLNYNSIWRSQEAPLEIIAILLMIAEEINTHILSTPGNPTTYAKSKRCWDEYLSKVEYMQLDEAAGLFANLSETKTIMDDAIEEEKQVNLIENEIDLLLIEAHSWDEIFKYISKNNQMSPNKSSIIKKLQKGEIPESFQLQMIMDDVKGYEKLGGLIDRKK